jgi:hypothetical protein
MTCGGSATRCTLRRTRPAADESTVPSLADAAAGTPAQPVSRSPSFGHSGLPFLVCTRPCRAVPKLPGTACQRPM